MHRSSENVAAIATALARHRAYYGFRPGVSNEKPTITPSKSQDFETRDFR